MKAKRKKVLAKSLLRRNEQARKSYCAAMLSRGVLGVSPSMSYLDPTVDRVLPVISFGGQTARDLCSNQTPAPSCEPGPTHSPSTPCTQVPRESAAEDPQESAQPIGSGASDAC